MRENGIIREKVRRFYRALLEVSRMKTNAIAGIVLTLILMSMLCIEFGIRPVSAGGAYIKNAAFEDQLNFWSVSSGTATYSADNTVSHSGSYSAKGVETNTGSLGRLYQDVTSMVVPGKQYRISGWMKTQDVIGQVVIGLDYVDSNGWTPADGYVKEIGYATGTTDWTYFEGDVFTLPSMPSSATAVWFLFDFNNGKGTAWWDDVSLIEVSLLPPSVETTDSTGEMKDEFLPSETVYIGGHLPSFRFRACIDGSDWVHIRSNEVWYVHRNFQYPGIHTDCPPECRPTYINGQPWYPVWPDDSGYDDYGQRSLNTYSDLHPPMYRISSLTVLEARGSVSIVQYPSSENDYTTILLLDDDPQGGASIYEFQLAHATEITYDLYVIRDSTITNGMAIPTRVPGTETSVTTDGSGHIPAITVAWAGPLTPGKYDIIVDVNGNGIYDQSIDVIDDDDIEVTAGFFVIPEYPVGTIVSLAICLVALGVFKSRTKSRATYCGTR